MARALASKRLAGHAEAAADTARAVAAEVGSAIRRAGRAALAEALRASRADTLALAARYRAALPDLAVPLHPDLNPPLWELGHIGWFQDWWLGRFSARLQGPRADPDAPRLPPLREGADALYDSSRVPHDRRWSLPLPDLAATRDDLAAQLERSLALLADAPEDDDALYCFRLVLLHEDMHREAWAYTAQALDIPLPLLASAGSAPRGEWQADGGTFMLGHSGAGFAFDNELGTHEVTLAPFSIERAPLPWGRFLDFIRAGGYDDERHWSAAGWQWRQQNQLRAPRYVQRDGDNFMRRHFGRTEPVDESLPAINLSAYEARAYCRWAGRRLPSEAEWEWAALNCAAQGEPFEWGAVWEWTASEFAPYPGFAPHAYRDYSAPWFDGRPVLRGASFATSARLRHPRYRNYFGAQRNDIFAGLRTCAI